MKYDFDKCIDRRNTASFKWDWCNLIFGTDDIIPMSIADMDICVPPQVVEALKKRIEHPVLGYSVKTEKFYEAVQNWMLKRHDWKIDSSQILSTPGIVPAINFAVFALTKPGDGILIQPPVYHPFFDAIELNDRKLLINNLKVTDKDKLNRTYYEIDFEDFDKKAAQAKLFILCSPHNPVGRVWTREELQKIGDICKKHNVYILSDEIHNDLVFKPNKHIPFNSLEDFSDFSITCMAPSKTFNVAGLCTSIMLINNADIRKAIEDTMMKTGIFMMNIFGMNALETCYNECEEWLEQLLVYLDGNRQFVYDYLEKELPELKVADSESTFLSWIDFNALGMSHDELERFLIDKAKVGFDTGLKYGDIGKGFMRLNFGCSKKLLEEALNRINQAIKALKKG